MRITSKHHGLTVTFTVPGLSSQYEGRISVIGSKVFVCHNGPSNYHGVNLNAKDKFGYLYAYQIPPDTDRIVADGLFNSFQIEEYSLLYKKDPAGNLFRRIYKIEDPLIYLGPICKDPDKAMSPSAHITISDYNYLQEKKWERYQKEISAEEKVKLASRSGAPL